MYKCVYPCTTSPHTHAYIHSLSLSPSLSLSLARSLALSLMMPHENCNGVRRGRLAATQTTDVYGTGIIHDLCDPHHRPRDRQNTAFTTQRVYPERAPHRGDANLGLPALQRRGERRASEREREREREREKRSVHKAHLSLPLLRWYANPASTRLVYIAGALASPPASPASISFAKVTSSSLPPAIRL